ncbi:sugar transferase [Lentibacter sp. XHP0401]|jgi:exopolysaccharide production protein ExoY|uniref:sugar transferase n=1 Tax=Lentibacter sp. XHP0401 TaxID=2984334 RepID=UPI0021E8C031|nr:sugar transferase [Lentibacter sp. XHP0401]MCV2893678.1 sugar transferase [Lentibacter sp. XHP0401]
MIYSDKRGEDYVVSGALFVKCQKSFWEKCFSGLYAKFFKRLIDIVLTLLILLPALFIMLPFAIMIALDGSSPLYFQRRVGKGGRVFRMAKLRSMCVNAENLLHVHLASHPDQKIEWDTTQKLRSDPRTTRIGNFIRRTSIDELPQLFNVLAGHMSLVGPRPMMEEQRSLAHAKEYFLMRPGITGEWQVSVRNEANFSERAFYDNSYFKNISLRHDFKLLWQTVRVVFNARGC